jgi:hypothetical protein
LVIPFFIRARDRDGAACNEFAILRRTSIRQADVRHANAKGDHQRRRGDARRQIQLRANPGRVRRREDFGGQVKHLAEANYEFFDGWNVGTPVDEAAIEKLTSKDDILKAHSDSCVYAHKAIDTITTNAFDSLGKDKGARAGMAAYCIAHSMDHYGQMVVYLRLNAIVPPASRKPGM